MGRMRPKRPSQGTADLLGLLSAPRLPAASRVVLSPHAVKRFVERCAPELSLHEARTELRRMTGGARVFHSRPLWAGPPGEHDADVIGYVVPRDMPCPVALPVRVIDGRYVATTCLASGSR